MLIASLMGAVAFQKGLGVVHSLAHPLSSLLDTHHGLANAVNIPYGMEFNIEGFEHKFKRIARTLELKEETGEAVVNYLFDLNSTINIPLKLREIGVKQEHIETLADLAIADFAHPNNPKPVSREDFKAAVHESVINNRAMKKRIGISFTKTKFEHYWNWFTPEDLQNDLELVELSFQKNNTEDLYTCDGFILTGGIDIDPSFYAGATDYDNIPDSFSPGRDQFEEKIYRYSQLHQLPVLGICRGMQLVNIFQGGKLIQDLGFPGNKKHYPEENTDNEHAIVADKDGLLFNITGAVSGKVNSAHHQAVDPDALGHNLKVNALADDEKTIEGLEFSDKTHTAFMLCVQWHPERMKDKEENPFSKKIKQQFLSAVRKNSHQKTFDHQPGN